MNRIININNIENNIYYKNNKYLFNQLIDILKTKRRAVTIINSNIELNNWINTVVDKLADKEYSLQTKIYWIINNYTTFPICPTCGKSLEHKNVFRIFKQSRYTYCNVKCCTNNENEKLKIKEILNNHKQLDKDFQKKINEKRIQTCIKKYGVKFISQAENIKNKN